MHSYKSVIAQVVGEAPSNFQNTVEITVGTRDGIAVGMPVTDGAGLIGKVTKVYPDRSVVMLITDPQFSVQAQVLSRVDDEPGGSTTSSAPPNTAISGRPLDTTTSTSTTTTIAPQSSHHHDAAVRRDAWTVDDLDEHVDHDDAARDNGASRDR